MNNQYVRTVQYQSTASNQQGSGEVADLRRALEEAITKLTITSMENDRLLNQLESAKSSSLTASFIDTEAESLRADVKKKNHEIYTLSQQIVEINAELTKLRSRSQMERSQFEEQIRKLNDEINQYRSSLHEMSSLRSEKQELLIQMEKIRKELLEKDQLRLAMMQLSSENERLLARLSEVEGLLIIRDREIFQIRSEGANFRSLLDKQIAENKGLKEREGGLVRQLSEMEVKFNSLLRDFDSVRGEMNGKNDELRKLSSMLDSLRRDMDLKSQNESRLMLELSDLRNQMSGVSGFQARIRDLEAQLKDKEGFMLSLSNSKRDLEDRVRSLQDQNASLEYQLKDLNAKLGDGDKEARRLEGLLMDARKSTDLLNEQMAKKDAEHRDQGQKLLSLAKKCDDLMEELRQKEVQMAKLVSDNSKDLLLESLRKDIDGYRSQLDGHLRKIKEQENLIGDLRKELNAYQSNIGDLEKQLKAQGLVIEGHQKDLSVQGSEMDERGRRIKELERLLTEKNGQFDGKVKELSEKSKLLDDTQKELAERTNELEMLRLKLQSTERDLQSALEAIQNAKNNREAETAFKKEKEQLLSQLKACEDRTSSQSDQIAKLNSEILSLKSQIDKLNNQHADDEKRYASLLGEHEQARQQLDGLRREGVEAQGSHSKEVERLKSELGLANQSREDLQKAVDRLSGELQRLAKEHESGEARALDLEAQLKELEEQNRGLKARINSLAESGSLEYSSLEERTKALAEKAAQLERENQRLSEQVKKLEGVIRDLEDELRKRSTVLEREVRTRAAPIESNPGLEEENDRLRLEISKLNGEFIFKNQTEETLNQLRKSVHLLQNDGVTKETRIKELLDKLSLSEHTLVRLQGLELNNQGLKDEIFKLQHINQEKDLLLYKMKEITSDMQVDLQQMPTLKNIIENQKAEKERLEHLVSQKDSILNEFSDKLNKLKDSLSQIQYLEQKIKYLEEENRRVSGLLNEREKALNILQGSVNDLQRANQKIPELQYQVQFNLDEISRHQRIIKDKDEMLAAERGRFQQYLKDLQKQANDYMSHIAELELLLREAKIKETQSLSSHANQVNNLQNSVRELTLALGQVKEENSANSEKFGKEQAKSKALEDDVLSMMAVKKEHDTVVSQLEASKNNLKVLSIKLSDAEERSTRQEAALTNLKNTELENQRLKDENRVLENKFRDLIVQRNKISNDVNMNIEKERLESYTLLNQINELQCQIKQLNDIIVFKDREIVQMKAANHSLLEKLRGSDQQLGEQRGNYSRLEGEFKTAQSKLFDRDQQLTEALKVARRNLGNRVVQAGPRRLRQDARVRQLRDRVQRPEAEV